jgi:hypothetical protein
MHVLVITVALYNVRLTIHNIAATTFKFLPGLSADRPLHIVAD